ncbi:rhodanese-related sulfurtransferase [Saonia flava]|uniref:Rhodanese-related sulfurtransferase n=1 Tax=Saonia flava TaxID=523696 RepID=A0A846R0S1_9FLAO|nr:rhodanese-like domain-containing protein [Saonia flava]NJB72552.1 rhodanese-related sulfurtransferase [Saonia flava]
MSFLKTFFGSTSRSSEFIEVISPEDFGKAIKNPHVQLVDVRTAREYNNGHIAHAVNIDFFDATTFNETFKRFDKEKPVYIYCRSGSRSQKAAARLVGMGFEKIVDLSGGYMAWDNTNTFL